MPVYVCCCLYFVCVTVSLGVFLFVVCVSVPRVCVYVCVTRSLAPITQMAAVLWRFHVAHLCFDLLSNVCQNTRAHMRARTLSHIHTRAQKHKQTHTHRIHIHATQTYSSHTHSSHTPPLRTQLHNALTKSVADLRTEQSINEIRFTLVHFVTWWLTLLYYPGGEGACVMFVYVYVYSLYSVSVCVGNYVGWSMCVHSFGYMHVYNVCVCACVQCGLVFSSVQYKLYSIRVVMYPHAHIKL